MVNVDEVGTGHPWFPGKQFGAWRAFPTQYTSNRTEGLYCRQQSEETPEQLCKTLRKTFRKMQMTIKNGDVSIEAEFSHWADEAASVERLKTSADFVRALERLPATDLDAATAIVDRFGPHFTFIPTRQSKGDWYFWNGKIHEKDERARVDDDLAVSMSNMLRDALLAIRDDLSRSSLNNEARQPVEKLLQAHTSYARHLRSAAGLARLRERIRIAFGQAPDYFDNDGRWVVMSDGNVIDLHYGGDKVKGPDPRRPVSRMLGVALNEHADHPLNWYRALDTWVPSKEEQKYLQVAAGAALLGYGDAKNIVTLVGVSHTGKSTYINVLRDIFGGYAGELPATAIVQKYGGASNFEQHKARGKRFLYLSEPQNQRTDDAFLKALSGGGDTISTSKKGQDAVEWTAQCVLHVAANHIPHFDTQDDAIVGRMNIVAFDHVFKPDSEDRNGSFVDELIQEEGPDILLWILEGAERYQELGYIPVPDSIRGRGLENVVDTSATLRWLVERVDEGRYAIDVTAVRNHFIKPVDGYRDFEGWCVTNNEKRAAQRDWLREIEAYNKMPRTLRDKKSGGSRRVFGVLEALPLDTATPCQKEATRSNEDRETPAVRLSAVPGR